MKHWKLQWNSAPPQSIGQTLKLREYFFTSAVAVPNCATRTSSAGENPRVSGLTS